MTIAQHQIEISPFLQRPGEPTCILDLNDPGIERPNDREHRQLDGFGSGRQQDPVLSSTGQSFARVIRWPGGHQPRFAAADGTLRSSRAGLGGIAGRRIVHVFETCDLQQRELPKQWRAIHPFAGNMPAIWAYNPLK